jgi:hypothetical protein
VSGIKEMAEQMIASHQKARAAFKLLLERIDPSVPTTEIEERALGIYKAPFRCERGYIYDADGEMVADDGGDAQSMGQVRGWGRIVYMADSEELQDAVGGLIAKALTLYWDLHAGEEDEGE